VIDRSKTRDIPLLATADNAVSLLGARVADTSSAASIWAPKPHIWAQAIRITKPSNLLQAGGRPHMALRQCVHCCNALAECAQFPQFSDPIV
jgi:hypothetical protein